MKALFAARQRMTRQGIDFERLQPGDQFGLIHHEVSKWITTYLKRVRKAAGTGSFRFLMVAEAHDSSETSEEYRGLPHYHVLLHECDPFLPVRKSVLDTWPHGFSKWRLVNADDLREVRYVCKYLGKDVRARVRASIKYGKPRPNVIAQRACTIDAPRAELVEAKEVST